MITLCIPRFYNHAEVKPINLYTSFVKDKRPAIVTRKFIALKAEKGCRADRLLVKSDAHVVGIALLAGVSQGVVELDHLVSTVEGHLEYIGVAKHFQWLPRSEDVFNS